MIPELRILTNSLPDNPLFFYHDGLLVNINSFSMGTHSIRHTAHIARVFSHPVEEITRTDVQWSYNQQYDHLPYCMSLRITLGYENGRSNEINFWEDIDEMPHGYARLISRNPSASQEVSYGITPTQLGEEISVNVRLDRITQQFTDPIGSDSHTRFLHETHDITQKAIKCANTLLADVRRTVPQWIQEN